MSATFDDRVFDYAMGTLEGDDLASFERDLARSAALRMMVREANDILGDAALALHPVEPSPDLKHRILAETVPAPWMQVIDRVARMWDLSVSEVRRTFARAMDPAEWNDAGIPGVSLFHLGGGPLTSGADVGIVRFEAGLEFPSHTHSGSESYVVLEGELYDSTGVVERVGEAVIHTERHAFRVPDDGPAWIALVMRGELVF